ncbi:peptidoglycan-binding protein [Planctomycetota bacterium]
MVKYKVKQGDCISSIAYQHGFFPDTIWNDPNNRELKRRRKDPNVLLPGDKVYIRDKEEKEESCPTEKLHRFRLKGVPEKLRMQFKINGKPRANEDYILDIDGALSEGKTDEKGKIEIPILPNAKKGKITFRDKGDEYELQLGHLDPVTEISGVQGRLLDLGFFAGPVDGKMSAALEGAIQTFQAKNGLEPNGKLDETTRKKIADAYGA